MIHEEEGVPWSWYKYTKPGLDFDLKVTLEAVKVDVSEAGNRDAKPRLVCLPGQCVKVAEPVLRSIGMKNLATISIVPPVCPGRQRRPCPSQIGPSQSSRSTSGSLPSSGV